MLVRRTAEAPADLGIEVIGVPQGSPVEFDLRLESVVEGVLVTGTAEVRLAGQCVRCLVELTDTSVVDFQELYVYPGNEAGDAETEDEIRHLEGDLLDLEPVLRDSVVLDLPFQPLCRPDCLGLCPDCGADLNEDPEHEHDAPIDPRWAGLGSWPHDEA
ncbi:DUF177 domain-containing protein [Microlunatus sp. Gsoil 973]|nr:DUF177 domain-containing protein [Microlunatus sp. Gsoil 973]